MSTSLHRTTQQPVSANAQTEAQVHQCAIELEAADR